MLEIKIKTLKHSDVDLNSYINIPIVDFYNGKINSNHTISPIGVVTDAQYLSENEIELTVYLFKTDVQVESITDCDGCTKVISASFVNNNSIK